MICFFWIVTGIVHFRGSLHEASETVLLFFPLPLQHKDAEVAKVVMFATIRGGEGGLHPMPHAYKNECARQENIKLLFGVECKYGMPAFEIPSTVLVCAPVSGSL